MIIPCEIFIVDRGFVPVDQVSPGDLVYTLDGMTPVISPVESLRSEYIRQTIHKISSGMNQIEATPNTRYPYYSEDFGYKLLSFQDIQHLTPNKEYATNKYLPVLTTPFWSGSRKLSDQEVESLARQIVVESIGDDFYVKTSAMTGEDAFVFWDVLEHWYSVTSGTGRFGKLNRKTRAFKMHGLRMVDELSRIAMLAGYPTMFTYDERVRYLVVQFDGRPVPGDVPKTQKYTHTFYVGNVYHVNADNRPIFGRVMDRTYFLPMTQS